jgi:hypothetical protein
LDIHEDKVGLGVFVEPADAFVDAVTAGQDGDAFVDGLELFDHILKGGLLVFYVISYRFAC